MRFFLFILICCSTFIMKAQGPITGFLPRKRNIDFAFSYSYDSYSTYRFGKEEQFLEIPESSGVYMMHAATKILFIGGSQNLKESISSIPSESCISKATRFRFREEKTCQFCMAFPGQNCIVSTAYQTVLP